MIKIAGLTLLILLLLQAGAGAGAAESELMAPGQSPAQDIRQAEAKIYSSANQQDYDAERKKFGLLSLFREDNF